MTAGMDLDRRLERWFADEAPAHAPDRVLAAAMHRVGGISQRRGLGIRVGGPWARSSRKHRLALVLASLIIVVVAAAAVGALAQRLVSEGGPPSLLVVRSDDGNDQATAISVVELDADGREHVIARFTEEQLGGTADLFFGPTLVSAFDHLAVSITRPDGSSGLAIADLRDPSAPVQQVDINGSYAAFAPDGDLGIDTPAGLEVHDPFTGTSSSSELATDGANYRPVALDRAISWTADSGGVLAETGSSDSTDDGILPSDGLGTMRRDGGFVLGTVPLAYDGIHARRTDPDGVLLRCAGGYDTCYDLIEWDLYAVTSGTQRVIWENPDEQRRISDFAWTVDGGLWLLLESAAPGPRHVSLVRTTRDGVETTIAEFDAPADDPDENAYDASSWFDGLAPDDSRLVVRIAGEQGARDTAWVVDTDTGDRAPLDGSIAGWRTHDAARRDRPAVALASPTDPRLRDAWATPDRTLRIGATSMILGAPGTSTRFTIQAAGADVIAVTGAGGDLGCLEEAVASYRWSIDADRVTLAVIDEPCPARRATLEGTFDRSLPSPDSGAPQVPGGRTYRAGAFDHSFRVTFPDGTPTEVWRHDAQTVALTNSAGDDGFLSVMIQTATAGAKDPCKRFSALSPLQPGAAGVLAYLDRAGIMTGARDQEVVDGHAATVVEVAAPAGCGEPSGLSLFPTARGTAIPVGRRARLSIFELRDGTPIVIIDRSDPANPAAAAWVDQLVDSIRFDQP